MSATLNAWLLLSVPGLPLLLAFPALRSRLPRPCLLALLPAVILLLMPTAFSIEVPWLLFGSGLGLDDTSRWLLAMAVMLWAIAATVLQAPAGQPADNRLTVFFLLTMAANLGAILATDLVGFSVASSLMGYGFYGLLVAGGDAVVRRAGRVYLGFMIVADLILFEVLLIAAATTGDLDFAAVHHAIALSQEGAPASGWYVSMVLAGFALKAGIWPLHFWLPLTFRSVRPAVALLLGGVPVAIALLGMVRWLPLGEISLPDLGTGMQWLGLATAVVGTVVGLSQTHPRALLAYACIVVTSLFVTILGSGLEWPMIGSVLQGAAHLFILALGFTLAALVAGSMLADKGTAESALWVTARRMGVLLLVLSPMMTLLLTRPTVGGGLHFAESGLVSLWPGWMLCTALLAVRWLYLLRPRSISVPAPKIPPGDFWLILERWFFRGHRWFMSMGLQVLPRWRASVLAVAGCLLQVRVWQKALDAGERALQNWTLAVTLLLLLGIAIALLST
jgi:multicomponent K+:H+ antiporter subunit D